MKRLQCLSGESTSAHVFVIMCSAGSWLMELAISRLLLLGNIFPLPLTYPPSRKTRAVCQISCVQSESVNEIMLLSLPVLAPYFLLPARRAFLVVCSVPVFGSHSLPPPPAAFSEQLWPSWSTTTATSLSITRRCFPPPSPVPPNTWRASRSTMWMVSSQQPPLRVSGTFFELYFPNISVLVLID